ncbi:MAG: TonB-dependent copper receptor [Gammaproteobacteria bacterium]|nr:MAG: TonB-dependent copper receptor [Gammaproteobacteria bacterium]
MCKETHAQLRIVMAIGLAIGLTADVSAETITETTRTITVESEPLPLLGGNRVIPEEGRGVASDGGELLRQVPGVSGSRLGGKGIDPAIRGMSQNRINILIDGAFVFGGCPNRMDPPASFANIEAYDQVTVLKGMQTLQHGAGGPGGTVLFERGTPKFGEDDIFNGKAAASYAGNGDRHSLFVDAATGNDRGYLRLQASTAESNNYEDGSGDKVRSAYEEDGLVLNAGLNLLNLAEDTRVELSLEATRADDVYYAGGMDAPVDDNDTVRFKLFHDKPVGPFTSLFGEIYQTDVEHVMDNYSLRILTAPMRMRVDVDSITDGVRLQADLNALGGEWTVGFEDQNSDRDALRFAGPLPVTMTQSYMWPDVGISQTGVFAEGEWELSDVSLLKAGLRYDHVRADADKADVVMNMGPGGITTANGLYQHYYGVTADKETEDNVGGLLRYERDFDGGTWFAGLSRTVRTADATERFMAANAGPMMGDFRMRWVGDPDIDPEKHHQAEIGAAWNGNGWNTGVVAWADWVDDYILRDRAHGQAGILRSDNASIYRNVDARLAGFEVEGDWRPAKNWKVAANAAYVRAKNTDEDRDIAQTPPLELTASVDYEQSNWSAGAVLRAAAKQTKAETDLTVDSGLDVDETSGWAVLDLHGTYRFNKLSALDFGIDNLFDKTYAYHLNRGNDFDPTSVQVNEPGRNAWVKVKLTW